MSACPKPPKREKSKRKRIAPIGRVAIRYEMHVRQPFLVALWSGGAPTADPAVRSVKGGASLASDSLPGFQGGEVLIERRPFTDAPPVHRKGAVQAGKWMTCTGHVHHIEGRNHGQREDPGNLVLVTIKTHRRIHT